MATEPDGSRPGSPLVEYRVGDDELLSTAVLEALDATPGVSVYEGRTMYESGVDVEALDRLFHRSDVTAVGGTVSFRYRGHVVRVGDETVTVHEGTER